MTKCTNPELGRQLYAWETGLLDQNDAAAFEQHLVECRFCAARAEHFVAAAQLIRSDDQVKEEISAIAEQDSRSARRRWSIPTLVAAAAVLLLMVLQPWQIDIKPTHEVQAGISRVAVFSFENLATPNDPDHQGELIARLLMDDLANSRYLHPVPGSRLRELVLESTDSASATVSISQAVDAARIARADWLLIGSIVQDRPRLVLSTELIDVASGDIVETKRLEAEPDDDIYALVDRLSVQVKSELSLPAAAGSEFDPPVAQVTSSSRDAYLYYIRGVDYRQRGYNKEAIAAFEMALEADSTFAMAWMNLAVLKDPKLIAKAMQFADHAGRRNEYLIRINQAMLAHDLDRLREQANELLAEYPDDLAARRYLAYYTEQTGHHAEAIAGFRNVIAADPLDRTAHLWLCRLLFLYGSTDEVIEAADAYRAVAPGEPQPIYIRSFSFARSGRLDRAIQDLEKVRALKEDFSNYRALIYLGEYYIFALDYDRANECFQTVVIKADRPQRSEARSMLGIVPVYQGKFNEGLKLLADGITADRMELASSGLSGSRALKHYARSMVFAEQNNFDSAFAEMETAIKVHAEEPTIDQPAFRCSYAQMLASAGEFARAEEIRDTLKAERDAGHDYAVYAYAYARGSIDLERGEVDSAFSEMHRELRNSHEYDGVFHYGRAALADGHYQEAAETFESLLRDYTYTWRLVYSVWSVKSYYYLGQAYEALDRREESIEAYRTFLHIMQHADSGNTAVDDARARLARLTS